MNLEQITFRVDIEGPQFGTLVHLINNGGTHFTVKIGEQELSEDDFSEFIEQLCEIRDNFAYVKQLAEKVNA